MDDDTFSPRAVFVLFVGLAVVAMLVVGLVVTYTSPSSSTHSAMAHGSKAIIHPPPNDSAASAWTLAGEIGMQQSDFPTGTVAVSYDPPHPDHMTPVPASTPCSPVHSQPFVADYDSQAYDPSGIGNDLIFSEVLIMPPANAQAALRAIGAPSYDTTCFQPALDQNSQTMTPVTSCGSFRFIGSSISPLPSAEYLPGAVMYRYVVNMSCTQSGISGVWYTDLISAQAGSTLIQGTFNSYRTPISAQIEERTMNAMAARARSLQEAVSA